MEHYWFLVEARNLDKEFESEKRFFEESLDRATNARELSVGEKCQKLALRLDKIAGDSFDTVAGDRYEQRPTHTA